ncbi:hypothetical protein BKA70DRAFT_1401249 [Coprinopsis sp. MPI-PUGE-AT-0042]|nr:hypothetical protein BKA70DRAFT_1401249 [Coprinopsis sp. MPI-PUGE-AT-0042]
MATHKTMVGISVKLFLPSALLHTTNVPGLNPRFLVPEHLRVKYSFGMDGLLRRQSVVFPSGITSSVLPPVSSAVSEIVDPITSATVDPITSATITENPASASPSPRASFSTPPIDAPDETESRSSSRSSTITPMGSITSSRPLSSSETPSSETPLNNTFTRSDSMPVPSSPPISGSLGKGSVIGIAIGSIVFVIILILVGLCIRRRRAAKLASRRRATGLNAVPYYAAGSSESNQLRHSSESRLGSSNTDTLPPPSYASVANLDLLPRILVTSKRAEARGNTMAGEEVGVTYHRKPVLFGDPGSADSEILKRRMSI